MAESRLLRAWCRDAGVRRSWPNLSVLAGNIDTPLRSVVDWLGGRRSPYLVNAARLAAEVGVSLDAVARACELAREREIARKAAIQARKDALGKL